MNIIKNSLFLTLLILSNLALSQDPQVLKKDIELYFQAIKEREIENLLLDSKQLQTCKKELGIDLENKEYKDADNKSMNQNQKLVDCVKTQLDSLSDDDLLKLAKQLNLAAYDKTAAKSAKSVNQYLNTRLGNAIFGDKKDAKGRLMSMQNIKIADHEVFYKMYTEQLGKNTLLTVSQYCLENFGFGNDKTYLVDVNGKSIDSINPLVKVSPTPPNKFDDYTVDEANLIRPSSYRYTLDEAAADPSYYIPPSVNTPEYFWRQKSQIKEYEVCSGEKSCAQLKSAKPKTPFRSLNLIQKLKEAEFKLAEKEGTEFIKARFAFCATSVVKNMCEIYKCNQIYDTDTPDPYKDKCSNHYDIKVPVTKANNKPSKKGYIACNILNRLEQYRALINATNDTKTKVRANFKNITNLNNTNIDYYSGGGQNSVDRLTSIGSTDLSEALGDNKEAQALRDNCFDQENNLLPDALEDPACEKLHAVLSKQDLSKIQANFETDTTVMEASVQKLETKDAIKKFLKENKMEGLIKESEFNDLERDDIVKLISDQFKARKNSELESIKQKFFNENDLDEHADPQDLVAPKTAVAEKSMEDIEQHKRRVEILYQYSNIVSSFLEVTDKDSQESKGQNKTSREIEIEANSRANSTSGPATDLSYFKDPSSSDAEDESKPATSVNMDYLGVLDAVLGDKEEAQVEQSEDGSASSQNSQ